ATHPSATLSEAETPKSVRLACVRHAASVRSEPGSNSQVHPGSTTTKAYAPARQPHSRASINARIRCAGHGRPQRRRPRIPSYLSTTSINKPPRPTLTRLRGAALIGPPPYLRQHCKPAFARQPRGAQRRVTVIVIARHVQGIVAENSPALQIRPRARSSANIRSEGASAGADRSGGASADARYRQP